MTATFCHSQSQPTTDGQSVSLSWCPVPIWGQRSAFYYCQTVAGFLMWDVLSDEWTVLFFAIATDPRQRSHSRVRVPWNSWPYFTKILDSPNPEDQVPAYTYMSPGTRLPTYTQGHWISFSSSPTASRATVEVFEPASTRVSLSVSTRLVASLYNHSKDNTENTATSNSTVVASLIRYRGKLFI
jgi:hypothetical protein